MLLLFLCYRYHCISIYILCKVASSKISVLKLREEASPCILYLLPVSLSFSISVSCVRVSRNPTFHLEFNNGLTYLIFIFLFSKPRNICKTKKNGMMVHMCIKISILECHMQWRRMKIIDLLVSPSHAKAIQH